MWEFYTHPRAPVVKKLKKSTTNKTPKIQIEQRKQLKPEEKLTIEISNFDAIHVNDFQIPKTRQSQVFEELAAQPPSSYDQHFHILLKVVPQLQYKTTQS